MIHSRHTVTYDTEDIKDLRCEIRYLCYCVQAFAFCSRDVRCSAARIVKRLDEMPTEDDTLVQIHRFYQAMLRKKNDLEFKGILYNAMLKRKRKRTRRNRK